MYTRGTTFVVNNEEWKVVGIEDDEPTIYRCVKTLIPSVDGIFTEEAITNYIRYESI